MLRFSLGLILLLCFSATSVEAGETPIILKQPEEIVRLLKSDGDGKRISAQLGMWHKRWGEQGKAQRIQCSEFEEVALQRAKLQKKGTYAVLQAASTDCGRFFVTIFQSADGRKWRMLRTLGFETRHSKPKISLKTLVEEGVQEIVVEGRLVDYGTGMHQQNITILKVVANSVTIVLNEVQSQVFGIPTSGHKNTDLEEESRFWFRRCPKREVLLQEQVVRHGGTRVRRWRVFQWNDDLQAFDGLGVDDPAAMPTAEFCRLD